MTSNSVFGNDTGQVVLENDMLMPAIEWVAEQIPGGFFVYRADEPMEMLYVNSATLRIFGCATLEEFKELTGYTFRGLVHPDDFQAIQDSIDTQIADETNENLDYVEYRIIRKDGTVRWVDDYGHFAHLPGYGDVYYVFIGDITDRRIGREEDNRRANVYSGMVSQFDDLAKESFAVVRSNLATGLIEAVGGHDLYDVDRVGSPIAESVKARAESMLVKGDKERYEECFREERLIERFKRGEGPATFIGYCMRQSGRQCFVKFSQSVVVDPTTGDLVSFGVETESNNEKVTEILNEKVLARQYDMVTYVVDNHYSVVIGDSEQISKGSIFPKRRDGKYMDYINQQVLPVVVGDSEDKAALKEALSPEAIADALDKDESYSVDLACEIDGSTYNKRFTFYAVDKDINFFLLLKSDITDVLRAERERNEILAEALREAEHANAAKTSFLSNMSHEIRTPMNAIIGLNSIALKDRTISVATREYLTKIGESARHLLGLINDVLDMSRIESGRLALRKEEFSFAGMLEQINTMVQAQCEDKGLAYECRIIGTVGDWYFGDDMKLKQVLINILSNAIKFTDPGGSVTFTVEKVGEFDKQTTLRFTVEDTGVGMDPEFVPRIFDPFTQEDSSRASVFGSTGLGMAISKNIIEMMNGTISVESERGVGTKFTAVVTLKNCDRAAERNHAFDISSMKVLVVDDDPIALEHAKMVLEEVGMYADVSASGAEALQAIAIQNAKHDPYRLVLLDWRMPDQDGVEVARQIREKYKNDTIIIVLTEYNWDDVMEEALDVGVDSFMSKPLFASNVLDEFEHVAERKDIASGNIRRVSLSGKRVLIAEDIMINAEIIKQLMSIKGVEVDHAENGQEALGLFANSEVGYYDAILMDVRMPILDGLQTTEAIRELRREDAKTVPIVAMTANAFDEDVQRSLQAGMNAHLSKPVEPDRLYETLSEVIGERQEAQELGE